MATGTLFLSLWDQENQSPMAAEIDALEVIGGQNIPYDLAVEAVLDNLGINSSSFESRISVILTEQPLLSSSSLEMLSNLDHALKTKVARS